MSDLKIVIHVGSSKTGTTSIQGCLNKNPDMLAEHGVRFIRTGRKHIAHTPIHRALRGETAVGLWQDIETELKDNGAKVGILSSEYFFYPRSAEGFDAYMPPHLKENTKVVAYIRRQDKYLESAYKQHVKVGKVRPDPKAYYDQRKHQFQYIDALNSHAQAFGTENVIVRPYERPRLKGGDVVQDFLQAIGLPEDERFNTQAAGSNKSLSREASEAVGMIARNTSMNARQIMREMQRSGDPALLRSDDVFDWAERREMMAYYAPTNAEIHATYGVDGEVLFDLSDLNHPPSPMDTGDKVQRITHAHEAALKAMERIQTSRRFQLYK